MDAKKAQLMEQELFAYYRSKMAEWDEYAVKETAEKEGMAKGLSQGLSQAALTIAVKMLQDGVDIELIAKYTGLSAEEIKNL